VELFVVEFESTGREPLSASESITVEPAAPMSTYALALTVAEPLATAEGMNVPAEDSGMYVPPRGVTSLRIVVWY
jgi:hypothetical protein